VLVVLSAGELHLASCTSPMFWSAGEGFLGLGGLYCIKWARVICCALPLSEIAQACASREDTEYC